MLLIGKSITTPADPLLEAGVEKIYKAITNPEGEVALLQQRLRHLKMIDVNQYRKMKTGLPYMVCAQFHPKVRRKENFLSTRRFLLDIDHLNEFDLDITSVKDALQKDPRVELLFTSPGGDGLKVLFKLVNKISDSAYYSIFYKSFCRQFAKEHRLGAAVDTKTNDVSRCCFVSFDPDAYYNVEPEEVNADDYLSPDSFADFDRVSRELKEDEKEEKEALKESGITLEKETTVLNDLVLRKIKEKVGARIKQPRQKFYEQPEELESIMKEIAEQLADINVVLDTTKPISYGRQLKVTAGIFWAELNIFYGQRGISVVGSTKNGSNKELRDSVTTLLKSHFNNK